ncbi:MAG: tol-pal system YbgF family protein [Planctomycetota bacterium]
MRTPLLLVALWGWAGPAQLEAGLERADALASKARQAEEKEKAAAVEAALHAYRALIAKRPKDREWVPKLRRRRASLLAHAGRVREALSEYDVILKGPASRYERARALRDSGKLLSRGGDYGRAVERFERVAARYRDIGSLAADALLRAGRCREAAAQPEAAERTWRRVVDRYRSEPKAAIAAYDALALQAIERRDAKGAERWLRRCMDRYAKRAARGDRRGVWLGRLLGEMKAPARLGEAAQKRPQ